MITDGSPVLPADSGSPELHVESHTGLPLFNRYENNPILTQNHWPYPINSVFNAGCREAARWRDAAALPC